MEKLKSAVYVLCLLLRYDTPTICLREDTICLSEHIYSCGIVMPMFNTNALVLLFFFFFLFYFPRVWLDLRQQMPLPFPFPFVCLRR